MDRQQPLFPNDESDNEKNNEHGHGNNQKHSDNNHRSTPTKTRIDVLVISWHDGLDSEYVTLHIPNMISDVVLRIFFQPLHPVAQ